MRCYRICLFLGISISILLGAAIAIPFSLGLLPLFSKALPFIIAAGIGLLLGILVLSGLNTFSSSVDLTSCIAKFGKWLAISSGLTILLSILAFSIDITPTTLSMIVVSILSVAFMNAIVNAIFLIMNLICTMSFCKLQ